MLSFLQPALRLTISVCRILPWCLSQMVVSVNVQPGHQRDRKISENSISVCKTFFAFIDINIINNYWMRMSMISWIIKTEVCVICRSRRLRQIIQTRGFDNSWYHAKTEFNNCFIIHFLNIGKSRHLSVEKWLYFKTTVKVTLISLTKII